MSSENLLVIVPYFDQDYGEPLMTFRVCDLEALAIAVGTGADDPIEDSAIDAPFSVTTPAEVVMQFMNKVAHSNSSEAFTYWDKPEDSEAQLGKGTP